MCLGEKGTLAQVMQIVLFDAFDRHSHAEYRRCPARVRSPLISKPHRSSSAILQGLGGITGCCPGSTLPLSNQVKQKQFSHPTMYMTIKPQGNGNAF